MKNLQVPEKRVPFDGTLDVHTIFYTIQGEGPFCGTPAVFIRLAGCNLQCPQCDTDYTSFRAKLDIPDILGSVRRQGRPGCLVVITGGEPFRQNLTTLILSLISNGHFVQIETNGSLAPPIGLHFNRDTEQRQGVYIVCSPKTGKVHPQILLHACAFKYVMSADSVDPEDGLPILALDHSAHPKVARPAPDARIYLQPVDEQQPFSNQENLTACIQSCLKHGYILQVQTHKLIGMP